MNNPSKIHAFFEKLSATVAETDRSSLEMLHSGSKSKSLQRPTSVGSLQDMMTATMKPPVARQWEVNDFGVGLPPLAHG